MGGSRSKDASVIVTDHKLICHDRREIGDFIEQLSKSVVLNQMLDCRQGNNGTMGQGGRRTRLILNVQYCS